MGAKANYRLNPHRPFEANGRKYVANFETSDLIEVNEIEWEILNRYGSQTQYQIVNGLKSKYRRTTILEAIERLEQNSLFVEATPDVLTQRSGDDEKPRLLVPFDFTREKFSVDHVTNLNRYQLLTHLSEFAELETLAFFKAHAAKQKAENTPDFEHIKIRQIAVEENCTLSPAWYAGTGYTGILLLSQFLSEDLSFYQIPDIPVVHYIDSSQRLQGSILDRCLTLSALQAATDSIIVKSSWMKQWLCELGIPRQNTYAIPDGIQQTTQSRDKTSAKQQTASLFDEPMFTQRPVVGLISGFEPHRGAAWLSTFAHANPHLTIFVYDEMLARYYQQPPENVVIFSANDEAARAVLPIFFQALDLVCFPAMPGTPFSVVLEAMASGVPCIAMTKYGIPPEVENAGIAVASDWDNFGNFHVPMAELSEAVNALLQPGNARTRYENVAKSFAQRFTWQETAKQLVRVFAESLQRKTEDMRTESPLFPPVFCRRYDPTTATTNAWAYRQGTSRYENLETTLAEVLSQRHTAAEVALVFQHFQENNTAPDSKTDNAGNRFPNRDTQETNPTKPEQSEKGEYPNDEQNPK